MTKKVFTGICIGSLLSCLMSDARAQAVAATVFGNAGEVWPEVDVYYSFNDKFRLLGLASATRDKASGGSGYDDGSLSLRVDYFAYPFVRKERDNYTHRGDFLWFRAGYIYKASARTAEDKFKDDIITAEINGKHHIPFNFLLTVKNRMDFRLRDNELFVRYRPRITIERNFKTLYLTFRSYVYGEYYFDVGSPETDRLRVCGGSEFRVTRNINMEFYYLYQFDNYQAERDLNALGIKLKVYFESAKMKADRDLYQ